MASVSLLRLFIFFVVFISKCYLDLTEEGRIASVSLLRLFIFFVVFISKRYLYLLEEGRISCFASLP